MSVRTMLAADHIGAKSLGDAAYINFWLFKRVLTDDEVAEVIEQQSITAYYGGPGQPYSRRAVVRRSKRWTLITQSGGLDI